MDWLWWVQIGADALLVLALVGLLLKLRAPGDGAGGVAAADVERFVDEAGKLSKEFDRLLNEKRQLVQTALATLDDRIEQLQGLMGQAEDAAQRLDDGLADAEYGGVDQPRDPQAKAVEDSIAMAEVRREVCRLADQGQSAAEIAEATGRPRGEVELILGLSSQKAS